MNSTINTRSNRNSVKVSASQVLEGINCFESTYGSEEQSAIRRFYQIREEETTPEYNLACDIKRYVLEQRNICALIKSQERSRENLESMVRLFPNTGSLAIIEQEHHDTRNLSGTFRKKYNRDHFIIIEGNGEEIAIAEEFFYNKGYKIIDAKTLQTQKGIKDIVGNLTFFHKEEEPSIYNRANENITKKVRGIKEHFCNFVEVYFTCALIASPLIISYVIQLGIRATENNEERGMLKIMKEDIFGKNKGREYYVAPKNQPFEQIGGRK